MWKEIITESATEADAAIRAHYDCAIIDTESITFSCYTCEVSVRWVG